MNITNLPANTASTTSCTFVTFGVFGEIDFDEIDEEPPPTGEILPFDRLCGLIAPAESAKRTTGFGAAQAVEAA